MFEGKPPQLGDARVLGSENGEGEFLRELTWADLVARLQLSRWRGEIGPNPEEGEASFNAGCARKMVDRPNGNLPVNREDSAIGKVDRRTSTEEIKGTGDGVVSGLRGYK